MSSHPDRWKTGLVFVTLAVAWILFRLAQVDYDASRFEPGDWVGLGASLFFLLLLVYVGFHAIDLIDNELSLASVYISGWSMRGKIVAAIVAAMMLAFIVWVSWLARYEVQPPTDRGIIVMLDRWTGTAYVSFGGARWQEIPAAP